LRAEIYQLREQLFDLPLETISKMGNARFVDKATIPD
jgi:hypothetical protein